MPFCNKFIAAAGARGLRVSPLVCERSSDQPKSEILPGVTEQSRAKQPEFESSSTHVRDISVMEIALALQ